MTSRYKTLVVNLFGGPGCGKSTNAARVFSMLKDKGVEVELVTEYAKDLVWEDRGITLTNQLYIFAKQNHRLFRLNGKVQVIITDSPLYLSLYYSKLESSCFKDLVKEVAGGYANLNIFLKRVKPYSENGRLQTEAEARGIDKELVGLSSVMEGLIEFDIPGSKAGCDKILNLILDEIEVD